MAVFDFGDLVSRRPGWLAAFWPRRDACGHVVGAGQKPAVVPAKHAATESGPRVLVVDDNPVNRMLASEMLALWDIDALQAADGNEAVALACERPLALILMDLQMPVLDGLGATRQIRRFELERARPRVPIVAYTSAFFGTSDMRLQHFGLDGLLAKPCEAHELHECLLQWCPAATAAAASAGTHDRMSVRR